MNVQKQRHRLPIHKHRTALLYMVETTATVIVIGETGCGKTTQIPQYLYEAGWAEGGRIIACTQPRRLAVQTVAARVAEETSVSLGAEVGYSIRFEDVTTPGVTKIKYLTDGVLIKEMMEDPLLTKYSVVMIDEAHERSIATDIMLGLLKKIQRKRPELRLIISSATMQAKAVASFFDMSQEKQINQTEKFPSLKPAIVSGRMHPVNIFYSEIPVENYIRAAVSCELPFYSCLSRADRKKKVVDVRAQLKRLLQRLGVKLSSCENDMQILTKAIASGFFVNASLLQQSNGEATAYKRLRGGQATQVGEYRPLKNTGVFMSEVGEMRNVSKSV